VHLQRDVEALGAHAGKEPVELTGILGGARLLANASAGWHDDHAIDGTGTVAQEGGVPGASQQADLRPRVGRPQG
jgi:hypothetical protein